MSTSLLRKKSSQNYRYFITCPSGLESVLKQELEFEGFSVLKEFPSGLEVEGPLEAAYHLTLSLRTASKVLLLLGEATGIDNPNQLYDFARTIPWHEVFVPQNTFAIHATESTTKFGAKRMPANLVGLKTKDALVDHFRDRFGERPNVSKEQPDVFLAVHLHNRTVKIYFDLAGKGLHERGYRLEAGRAPIRENVAAGLLMLAGWTPKLAATSSLPPCFLDPFCGSGTIAIEAALIATRTVPGLIRTQYSFFSWRQHQPSLYEKVLQKFKERVLENSDAIPALYSYDVDGGTVALAQANGERAKMNQRIQFKQIAFEDTQAPLDRGLMVFNPPYGVRLGELEETSQLYQRIGSHLKHHYRGWNAGIISSEIKLFHSMGLKPSKKFSIQQGGLDAKFFCYDLY